MKTYKRSEVEKLTVPDIKVLVRKHNLHTNFIKNYSRLRKADLIDKFMEHYKPLPPYIFITIAAQIVFAIEEMRKVNVCHRVLRPKNILMSDKSKIAVSHFAEAKVVRDPNLQSYDESNTFEIQYQLKLRELRELKS